MRTQTLKILGSALVLAASIGTFSAFAHDSEGQGQGMMSGGMGGMMQMMNMMSDMSPDEHQAMTQACMKMMQSQPTDQTGTDAKE